MVRRDYNFLVYYFKKQLGDPANDKNTVLRMIMNIMIQINQSHTNFNPIIFWEKATDNMVRPAEFDTLFPESM